MKCEICGEEIDGRSKRKHMEQHAQPALNIQELLETIRALQQRVETLEDPDIAREKAEQKLEEANREAREKRATMTTRIANAPRVTIVHHGEPMDVNITYARHTFIPGENVVPQPIADAYKNKLKDIEYQKKNDQYLREQIHKPWEAAVEFRGGE